MVCGAFHLTRLETVCSGLLIGAPLCTSLPSFSLPFPLPLPLPFTLSPPLPFPPPSSLWPPSVVSCFLQLFVHCHDLFYLDLSNNQISELLHKPHASSHTRHASFYLVCTVCTNTIQILCSKDLVVESCVVLVGPHLGNSLFLLRTTVMLKGSVVYSGRLTTLCYQYSHCFSSVSELKLAS